MKRWLHGFNASKAQTGDDGYPRPVGLGFQLFCSITNADAAGMICHEVTFPVDVLLVPLDEKALWVTLQFSGTNKNMLHQQG